MLSKLFNMSDSSTYSLLPRRPSDCQARQYATVSVSAPVHLSIGKLPASSTGQDRMGAASMTSAVAAAAQPLAEADPAERHVSVSSRVTTETHVAPCNGLALNVSRPVLTRLANQAAVDMPSGTTRTFYKRDLPSPPAIAFSSQEGMSHTHLPKHMSQSCS
jgi:hypothetical protein